MARSIRNQARGALPQRYRTRSQRGTHEAGHSFRNAQIVDASVDGSDLTITVDQPVALRGLPGTLTDVANAVPVSASVNTAGMVITITYSESIAAATEVHLVPNDPAIRSRSGGWLVASVFPVPGP